MRSGTQPDDSRLLIEEIREIAEELHSMSSGMAMLCSTWSQPSQASLDEFAGKVEKLRQLAEDLYLESRAPPKPGG